MQHHCTVHTKQKCITKLRKYFKAIRNKDAGGTSKITSTKKLRLITAAEYITCTKPHEIYSMSWSSCEIDWTMNNDSMFASHHQSPFIWLADSSKAPSAVHNPRTPLNNGMVQAPCKGKMAGDDRATLRHFFRAVKHHFNE